jgi:hypothetical protein
MRIAYFVLHTWTAMVGSTRPFPDGHLLRMYGWIIRADSTGGCNSLMESFGWRLIIQSLPRDSFDRRQNVA